MTDAQSAQTALDKLIEAVEAGTLQNTPYRGMQMASACYPKDEYGRIIEGKWSDGKAMDAYHGRLTAAAELHDLLLPGWKWGRQWSCHMWVEPADPNTIADRHYGEETETPARAWLLAILRAYRSVQP